MQIEFAVWRKGGGIGMEVMPVTNPVTGQTAMRLKIMVAMFEIGVVFGIKEGTNVH